MGFSSPIADLLIDAGELAAYDEGAALMEEGAIDKDIYFLVAGLVSIRVNDREIALRASGQHVGEMAMIDPTSLRSATVVALEDTAALKVPEPAFANVANQYPALWRRLAAELAGRSRASNKGVHHVNERPVLFVASSSDDFSIANLIRSDLARDRIIVRLWKRNAFAAGRDTVEDMSSLLSSSDFGVILCNDGLLRSRNGGTDSVRDNLLLEVGMSTGVLGRARTFLVTFKPNGPDPAGDSLQVLSPDFFITDEDLRQHAAASLCNEIRGRVQFLGPR